MLASPVTFFVVGILNLYLHSVIIYNHLASPFNLCEVGYAEKGLCYRVIHLDDDGDDRSMFETNLRF